MYTLTLGKVTSNLSDPGGLVVLAYSLDNPSDQCAHNALKGVGEACEPTRYLYLREACPRP